MVGFAYVYLLVVGLGALFLLLGWLITKWSDCEVTDPDEQQEIVQRFVSHAQEQAVINKFTNHERNLWARRGYPLDEIVQRFRKSEGCP